MSTLEFPVEDWWIGFLLENGEEPEDPAYRRQPVRMERIEDNRFANLDQITVGPSTVDWGLIVEVAVFSSRDEPAVTAMLFHHAFGPFGPVYAKTRFTIHPFDLQMVDEDLV